MRLHKKKRLRALEDRTPSERLESEESLNTRIGREIRDRLRKHPEESGVHLLQKAHDAFASRVLLAQTAEKTLDIQYYIWKKDLTGMLMFKSVLDAADRGVRVDRKSTRLNSSHVAISYAVFCLKKNKTGTT